MNSVKKSRLLHIDKRKAHGKSYWAENAGEINEKRKQKITCECGQFLSKWDISKHLKSSTHKYFVEHGVNRPQKAEKIKCECGTFVTQKSMPRHTNTQLHSKLMSSNNINAPLPVLSKDN